MSTLKQLEASTPEQLSIGLFVCQCGLNIVGAVELHAVGEYVDTLYSSWCYSQTIVISTASQKRMEAVERRMVIEDVV